MSTYVSKGAIRTVDSSDASLLLGEEIRTRIAGAARRIGVAEHPRAPRGTYHLTHLRTNWREGEPRAERAFRLAAARSGAIFPGFFSES